MRTPVHTPDNPHTFHQRLKVLSSVMVLALVCLLLRLAYWQIIKGSQLRAEAAQQYQRLIINQGHRGQILTADGFTLVGNETVYDLYGEPHNLKQPAGVIARQLLPFLSAYVMAQHTQLASTDAAQTTNSLTEDLAQLETSLIAKLSKSNSKWVSLFKGVSETDKNSIAKLELAGITFEKSERRLYPEASLAAQITGFVGADTNGEPLGYFGVEGALNKELEGKLERRTVEADAVGGRLSINGGQNVTQGRDVILTVRRDIQYMAETYLAQGIERYGAQAGEVIIMEPQTGKILAMASYPSYDQKSFQTFSAELYKNPSVSTSFEPGSTFKTLTIAAGIDAGVISENTSCPSCDGPRKIANYTLRTWNNEYSPGITMSEALAKSDNTAMIYVSELLGSERFQEYLRKFAIDQPSHVELQEDTAPPFPSKWGPVELATRSFGQGISTTSLQLVKAVNAIANQGKMMRPMLVDSVIDHATNQEITNEPIVESQPISAETAKRVSQMMIYAAQHGEAQWTASRTHEVAGKTGTAQIAVNGSYDSTKTIASFIGFTPANNPRFIMLVKLVEPSTSPWAAETAAPLWYKIAERLYLLLSIPPDFPRQLPQAKIPNGTEAATSPSAAVSRPTVGD